MKKHYSLRDVSIITGIPHTTLRQRINRGTLKAMKLGRMWFIRKDDVCNIKPGRKR